MRTAVDVPLPRLLAQYEEQSARYRRLVAGHDLNATAERPLSDHLDVVRELVDGRTGA